MDGTPDISKVISLIMQRPELIEAIRTMVSTEGEAARDVSTDEAEVSATDEKESATASDEASLAVSVPKDDAVQTAAREASGKRKRRNTLLHALKPYVSKERARAIDTMMTIADMLDAMKGV